MQLCNYEPAIHILLSMCQRAQPEELERIKKHYETSEEEEVKLLDKPEQSVSHLLTQALILLVCVLAITVLYF